MKAAVKPRWRSAATIGMPSTAPSQKWLECAWTYALGMTIDATPKSDSSMSHGRCGPRRTTRRTVATRMLPASSIAMRFIVAVPITM